MSQINESPLTGRGKEAFRKPLRRGGNGFIVTSSKQSAVAMTSQVYTKPTNRNKNPALVSPKHCELSPWFVADLQIKTNPIFVLQREELPTYPLSASTDITGNGDGWKNKYRPLAVLGPMSGKWGSYTFNLTTGRE